MSPSIEDLSVLLGKDKARLWEKLSTLMEEWYGIEPVWGSGGKRWIHEWKYRKGGKTLCALYAREGCLGFMIIFGKEEQRRYEAASSEYTVQTQEVYRQTPSYHDGAWIMLKITDGSLFDDIQKLLSIKRKPLL